MSMPGFVISVSLIGMTALVSGMASGQNYPNKPLRIVTGPAGGGGDSATRAIARWLEGPLGQSVIVENRPTATIGAVVSRAPADGYTLALLGNSFWISSLIQQTNYDPVKDVTAVTLVERSPIILVVHPALPVKSVRELIALAKARPGELNYAGAAQGAASFNAAELFNAMAGVKIIGVNYSGGAPAITALIGGEVQLRFATVGEAMSFVKSGRLRALAVTSTKPSALAPGVPALAETVPGYESVVMQAVFAPGKTPDAILNQLNGEIVRVLNRAEIREQYFNNGAEVASSSREEAAAAIKNDMANMGKMLKGVGIAR